MDQIEKHHMHVAEINLSDELVMYGLITKNHLPPAGRDEGILARMVGSRAQLLYSEKLGRYKYWLSVNGKAPEHIEVHKKEPLE
ncbi:MAG: hypothetical protein EPN21_16965 [Methylococcaceae bacterium]|nr:MAG: hypothetical protein EPN21_16965 [Methylococcaceae bacterium]